MEFVIKTESGGSIIFQDAVNHASKPTGRYRMLFKNAKGLEVIEAVSIAKEDIKRLAKAS